MTALQDGRDVMLLHPTPGGRTADGSLTSGGHEIVPIPADPILPAFAPASSSEQNDARDQVVTQDAFYMPTGTYVTPVDKILVAGTLDGDGNPVSGLVYEVDGDPSAWVSPFDGWAPGVEVRVKRITG